MENVENLGYPLYRLIYEIMSGEVEMSWRHVQTPDIRSTSGFPRKKWRSGDVPIREKIFEGGKVYFS